MTVCLCGWLMVASGLWLAQAMAGRAMMASYLILTVASAIMALSRHSFCLWLTVVDHIWYSRWAERWLAIANHCQSRGDNHGGWLMDTVVTSDFCMACSGYDG